MQVRNCSRGEVKYVRPPIPKYINTYESRNQHERVKTSLHYIDYWYNKFYKRISVFDFCINDVNIEI